MGGHLPEDECTELLSIAKTAPEDFDHFVETGTYKADTTLAAASLFKDVHSFEIVEALHNESKEKCRHHSNIHLHLGDTMKLLPTILPSIKGPCVWFLDAHQSGQDTSNNGTCVPLLDELNLILSSIECTSNVFIIDDVRLFSKYWDWEGISLASIEKVFQKHDIPIYMKFVKNDRYVIRTK